MKTLMKQALQEVLESEMTEQLGTPPSSVAVPETVSVPAPKIVPPDICNPAMAASIVSCADPLPKIA